MGIIKLNDITYDGGGGDDHFRYVNDVSDENFGWIQYQDENGEWVNYEQLAIGGGSGEGEESTLSFKDSEIIRNGVINPMYTCTNVKLTLVVEQCEGYVSITNTEGGVCENRFYPSIDASKYTKLKATITSREGITSPLNNRILLGNSATDFTTYHLNVKITDTGDSEWDISSIKDQEWVGIRLSELNGVLHITDLYFE